MSKSDKSETEQLSNLPSPNFYLTGHDESSGKAIIQEHRNGSWTTYDDKLMAFNVVYTTSEFPASLDENIDIKKHDALMESGNLGLVNKNGTVCRIVDFAPGFDCMMHRTQSLDYGRKFPTYETPPVLVMKVHNRAFSVSGYWYCHGASPHVILSPSSDPVSSEAQVLEGSIELIMDSGDTQLMNRGDVAVQRGTMHAWRNPSTTEWARMLFVLQDSQKITLGGQTFKEDLGRGVEGLPPSGNDF